MTRLAVRPPGGASIRFLPAAVLGLVVLVATACKTSGASSLSTPTTQHRSPEAAAVSAGTAKAGALGTILVDQTGRSLYRYSLDRPGKATCTGACATVWSPLTAPSETSHVTARSGIDASDLGIISGTRQVTFKGMPLYLYVGDTKAGQANGQGVGGTWFVVAPAARSTVPSSSTTTPPATVTTPSAVRSQEATATAGGSSVVPATSPPVASPPATTRTTSPPVTSPPATSPPTTQGGGYGY